MSTIPISNRIIEKYIHSYLKTQTQMTVKVNNKPQKQLFSEKASEFRTQTVDNAVMDIKRTLFFSRIAQLNCTAVGKSEILDREYKELLQKTAQDLRHMDQKIRPRLPKEIGEWLTVELNKEKVYDMANIMELMARVGQTGDEEYDELLEMLTTFLDRTLYLQARKKKLNLPKYRAIFNFLTYELRAEANGGQTAVEYNDTTGLSFRMVQPETLIQAKPTVE